jgi:DNA-binding NarL/FixJ family response regulator
MVRVLVVADDVLARAGLVGMLAARPELVTVVGQVPATDASPPPAEADALLWDAGLPAAGELRGGGVPALDAPWLDGVDQPVVALVNDDRQAAAALAVGARAVLPRDAPAERIVAALTASQQGLIAVDESFAEALGRRRGRAEPLLEPLTPREVEVLGLIAEGLPNKTIAGRLGIGESTVKFHVNAILGKLGVESRSEAIVQAARLGLVIL